MCIEASQIFLLPKEITLCSPPARGVFSTHSSNLCDKLDLQRKSLTVFYFPQPIYRQ